MQKNTLEIVEQSQRKLIDSFFIHQCVIRIFKNNHHADYCALLNIRNDIEFILELRAVPKLLFELSSTQVAMASISFIEMRQNRKLLASKNAKHKRDEFCKHLSACIKRILSIEIDLSEDNIDKIINILEKNIDFCEALISKYNIFDYFSLFSMTVYIPFDKFYKFYRDSFHDKTELPLCFKNVAREAKWLYAMEDEIDSNIFISKESHCYIGRFNSPNVHVIDDYYNDIVINGIKSQNALYLKVSLDQSPSNIDRAVEYYKNAIVDKLINKHGCMANTNDDGFGSSKFMKFYNKGAFLVTQWNCIDNNIIGLWCWDLVENEHIAEAKAIEVIAKSAPYEKSSIRKDYDEIDGILSRKSCKKKKITLDQFVTGSDRIILGIRRVETC